jgi:hypothetical protein
VNHTGIAHADIEATEAIARILHSPVGIQGLREIGMHHHSAAAEPRNRACNGMGIAALDQGDIGAQTREPQGDRSTNAATGAGHQCRAAQ